MRLMDVFARGLKRRRMRRGGLGFFRMVGVALLAVRCARPGSGAQPPTVPATATVPQPTATSADTSPAACPKDPSQWRLVKISTFRDPHGVPLYRN
ncbi:hypothetical protein [Thermoflexus sp.]|uniref:hypothetical protein n=1 Tax=Thermoflexus sp. TaxID=1969742 RepID=UPI0035E41402